MRIPVIEGIIERRILVNYRVKPQPLSSLLPEPFKLQLVDGWAIAGICLIRLAKIRPRFLPAFCGIGSENAAHRIAVRWEQDGQEQTGVYIPRRDISSRINSIVGGRLFPGEHQLGKFDVRETNERLHIAMHSADGQANIVVDAEPGNHWPEGSVFQNVTEASDFFQHGSIGYSPSTGNGNYDGLELRSFDWRVQPLKVSHVESSFFENESVFSPGDVEFDNALLMRQIHHQWHSHPTLCCG